MTEVTTTQAVSDSLAAAPAAKEENIGTWIIDHISNSDAWHLPGLHIHLPQFDPINIMGYSIDLSITNHVVMLWIAILIMLVLAFRVKKKNVQSGVGMIMEMVVLFIRDDIAIPNMGEKDGRKFTPLLTSFFLFILIANYMGLIPLFTTSTANFSVTVGLGLVVFLSTQIYGIKANGLIGYYKGLVPHGVPMLLWPLMFIVEFVGLISKHIALMIRLLANMTAGHIVLFALIGLAVVLKSIFVAPVSVAFGLFIYFLELLVATIQAFIFTLLAALFIGGSIHQDH